MGIILISFSVICLNQFAKDKSIEYLQKANSEKNLRLRIRDLEVANLLYSTSSIKNSLGNAFLEYGDYKNSIYYFKQVQEENAEKGLAKAYYNILDYNNALKYAEKYYQYDEDIRLVYISTLLKQGKLDLATQVAKKSNNQVLDKLWYVLRPDLIGCQGVGRNYLVFCTEISSDNNYIARYNALKNDGFPHAATRLLEDAHKNKALNVNGLLVLAKEQIQASQYEDSETILLEALLINPHYPQIYQQLVVVEEKLDKSDRAKEYKELLQRLSW